LAVPLPSFHLHQAQPFCPHPCPLWTCLPPTTMAPTSTASVVPSQSLHALCVEKWYLSCLGSPVTASLAHVPRCRALVACCDELHQVSDRYKRHEGLCPLIMWSPA
jgi:hypothetical protein